MSELAIVPAHASDVSAILDLLRAASLPDADLQETPVEFFVARDRGQIIGAVGLEGEAPDALLRSLVVAPSHRGRGVGRALVARLAARAAERGVRTLHLLTTTAADFFAGQGFARAPREGAPVALLATAEFRALCPDTATYMRRALMPR